MIVSTFTLGDLYLGIDIILVREINRSMECTPVPGAQDYIRGMLNIRGRVITLFDLKRRLGWSVDDGETVVTRKRYNVIMKTHEEVLQIDRDLAEARCPWQDPVGLVVDQLGDVREIVEDNIQPPPANLRGISAEFIHGVVEFKNNLLVILNVAAVLGVEQHDGG
ncbi:MAG: chemotaxis protein CheW [Magnetococcales bacterium]|nr:chemotaxis protein CheW [Magnetococcales bacterium]